MLAHAREYVKKIKKICVEEIDKNCRVILFGSIARGNYRVDSDIDVLIITELANDIWKRAEIAVKIHKRLGFSDPLELHIVTLKIYEEWYKRFIDVYEEF
ncbi:nucleotidyltransferase domain-containing protein [Saccharolobus shibatae]|uniref:nucleotidyltransferase domain-containing protein n=1 Tax=Saccharolobus shibatae TaxID=2286 RepID=UPI001C43DD5C|nr:nucleotidyltransferase domain-containing protein [Saccharolobus shibatae]